MTSMIVAARCNHRRRAIVLDTICVSMHALVQLRRSAQRERVEESRGDENRDKRTSAIYGTPECPHGVREFLTACRSAQLFFRKSLRRFGGLELVDTNDLAPARLSPAPCSKDD